MSKISLIIVTYNSEKHIFDCLDSVLKFNDIGDELDILIVDNASAKQVELFTQLKLRYSGRVRYINSERNGGYGFGNNVGIRNTNSDIIVVMNPDVRIENNIFGSIIKCFTDSTVGMIGVSFIDGTPSFYLKRGYSFVDALLYKFVLRYGKYNPYKMYMSGSFLGFKREAIIKAGCFDENIFMYSEEADITNRILSAGYAVCLHPEIMVRHLAHDRKFNFKLNQIRMESGLYYEKKYGLNSKKIFNTEKRLLKFKIVVASLLNKKNDKERLQMYLTSLQDFYNQNVLKTDNI